MKTRELVIFAAFAGLMFTTKIAMQVIPNVHLVGMLLATLTLVYGKKALFPLYAFVLLDGMYVGFSTFWMPNLYIWLPLWGTFMVLRHFLWTKSDKQLIKDGKFHRFLKSPQFKTVVFMFFCGLHGLSFGILYAPFQAFIFGLSFQGMIAWIVAGIPFDIIHGLGNFASGILIFPLAKLLRVLENKLGTT